MSFPAALSVYERYVAWRASRIAPPEARLRYLRRVALPPPARAAHLRLRVLAGLAAGALVLAGSWKLSETQAAMGLPEAAPTAPLPPPLVWLVERTAEAEVFSNGLRIEVSNSVRTTGRSWRPIRRKDGKVLAEQHSEPAGVVFHTTESQIPEFLPDLNQRLRTLGRAALDHARRNRSYHYFIDRFGRTFRLVEETDVAFHAGHSVWGDHQWLYVNLNHSFLGVTFESQTSAQQAVLTAAQMRAGRLLVEMLRCRYQIPPGNFVTHAQVSVNPVNWRIGAHTDWAAQFPFETLGLPPNYTLPPPAFTDFGFTYDDYLLSRLGRLPWPGLSRADQALLAAATAHQQDLPEYRLQLRQRYREILAALRARDTQEEVHVTAQ